MGVCFGNIWGMSFINARLLSFLSLSALALAVVFVSGCWKTESTVVTVRVIDSGTTTTFSSTTTFEQEHELQSQIQQSFDHVADELNKHFQNQWVVEQMPGGGVAFDARAGAVTITITDKKGCTLWWRQKLAAPVVISYEVTMSADARVSDMNCFWMASDPKNPGDLFYENNGRTGKFSTYDSLNTYYVGYGGNGNTSTRFRRYDGTGARPLLPEHDLADAAHLLKAGHAYKIELIASDGEARFVCDGETVFRYADPKPLTEGWFGFRTVNSKMVIRNFRVTKPGGVTKSE